jgi:hypothetical protein
MKQDEIDFALENLLLLAVFAAVAWLFGMAVAAIMTPL